MRKIGSLMHTVLSLLYAFQSKPSWGGERPFGQKGWSTDVHCAVPAVCRPNTWFPLVPAPAVTKLQPCCRGCPHTCMNCTC